MYQQAKIIGEKLFMRGLNNSHSGNISMCNANTISITRTGSSLDSLTVTDIVEVDYLPNPVKDKAASMELIVHRAIYNASSKVGAIVHAHPPYAVAVAKNQSEIVPYDDEAKYFLKKIPVLSVENSIASVEIAQVIGNYVKDNKAIIIEKHGVFAWGETLEDAYHYLMVVDSACRINYLIEAKNVT